MADGKQKKIPIFCVIPSQIRSVEKRPWEIVRIAFRDYFRLAEKVRRIVRSIESARTLSRQKQAANIASNVGFILKIFLLQKVL
jgi:ribosomal protein L32E